jgi:hypothetical protein
LAELLSLYPKEYSDQDPLDSIFTAASAVSQAHRYVMDLVEKEKKVA